MLIQSKVVQSFMSEFWRTEKLFKGDNHEMVLSYLFVANMDCSDYRGDPSHLGRNAAQYSGLALIVSPQTILMIKTVEPAISRTADLPFI
jgi:hypothetical protein